MKDADLLLLQTSEADRTSSSCLNCPALETQAAFLQMISRLQKAPLRHNLCTQSQVIPDLPCPAGSSGGIHAAWVRLSTGSDRNNTRPSGNRTYQSPRLMHF